MQFVSGLKRGSKPDGILVFGTVLNEIQRLPYFLEYHREIGISHFFLVDNGSDDGSSDYLATQSDVTLYSTTESYNLEMRGVTWLDELKFIYAQHSWVLTLDIDELFVYPKSETIRIDEFCRYLDQHNYDGVFSLMIDFYDNKRLCDYKYERGKPFWEFSPYFDSSGYFVRPVKQFPYFGLYGGPRYRVFFRGQTASQGPTMRKIPLVKWSESVDYLLSTHSTPKLRLADVTSAILHFRFLVDFEQLMQAETVKHYIGLSDHARYLAELGDTPTRNLVCETSLKYQGSQQLISISLLKTSKNWNNWLSNSSPSAPLMASKDKQMSGNHKSRSRIGLRSFAYIWPTLAEQQFNNFDSITAVAVVIRVLDNPRYLHRAVKSALNQPEAKRVFLVRGNLSEATEKVLRQIELRYSKVDVLMLDEPANNASIQSCLRLVRQRTTSHSFTIFDSTDTISEARLQRDLIALSGSIYDGVLGRSSFNFESAIAQQKSSAITSRAMANLERRYARSDIDQIIDFRYGLPHYSTLTIKSSTINTEWFSRGNVSDAVFSLFLLLNCKINDKSSLPPASSLLVSEQNLREYEVGFDPTIEDLLVLLFLIVEDRGKYIEASYLIEAIYIKLTSSTLKPAEIRQTLLRVSETLCAIARSYLFLMLDCSAVAPRVRKHLRKSWREAGIDRSQVVWPDQRWEYTRSKGLRRSIVLSTMKRVVVGTLNFVSKR